jgi:hypothetical protein
MRLLSTTLLLTLFVAACGDDNEEETPPPPPVETLDRTPQANDLFLTLEGSTIDPAEATASAWFKDTYLSTLSTAPGVMATRHYAPLAGPPPLKFPGEPTDLTVFHFADQGSHEGFVTSDAADEAETLLADATGVTQTWRSQYVLSSSADNGNSTGDLPVMTVIGLVIDPAVEADVLDWEDNTHVPWVMKYKGIAKIVRYQKAEGGTDDDALPKYLEFFYFYSPEDAMGLQMDQNFIDAEADRMATWTDAQLGINPIVAATLAP